MESLTRPAHRRKLSNASGAFSFSSRNAYDDVFAVPLSAVPKFKAPSGVEDYGEIFGGGSRGSSIPVLDLSALDEPEDFRSSKLDYVKIFGGFRDEDIAAPYEELLRKAANGGKFCADKQKRDQSDKESPPQASDNCNLSGKNKVLSSEASDQSVDGMKQLYMSYHKTIQRSRDGTSGTTHVAKLHAVPGFTYFVDETLPQQKTEGDRPVPSIKSEVHRTWSFSGDIHEENNGRKTETHMPNKLTSEGVVRGKRGSWGDGSHSSDKLFNASEINLKSNSLKTYPSSSPPSKINNSKGHPKQSRSSKFSSQNPFENTAGDFVTGSSDEEIDINSAAAASSATLKRAIEKARESIRLAKELMERKKDGLQGFSRSSSEGKFKVEDKKVSRNYREANSIKDSNAKESCEKFDHVLQGFTEINRRVTSRSDEVATTFEHSEQLSTSREVEVEKHQGNVTEVHAEETFLLDLVNNGNQRTTTLSSGQIENKNTLLQSMDKQACHFDGMKIAEETFERVENNVEKTEEIGKDLGPRNAENKVIVDQRVQESEQTVNKSDFAPIVHECGESNNLKNTPEDILAEDILNDFDKRGEFETKLGEHLDITEEEYFDPLESEDDYMLNESNNLVKEEKEIIQAFQQVRMGTKSEDVHARKESKNGLGNSCNEGGCMVQKEARQFVENDVKSTEVCSSASCEKTYEDTQEGEESEISDIVQEREIDEMELFHAHNREDTWRIPEEEFDGQEVEDLNLNEKEPTHAPDGEKSKKILKEELEGEEVQNRPEETYNYVEADEEFDWEEVEKRIKEACVNEATEEAENQNVKVIQEAEEAESMHFKAGNLDNNQEIEFLQKADCERDSDTAFDAFSDDANTSLHEVQEACTFKVSNDMKTSQDADGNREDNSSTPGATEAFYKCEVDANEGEESIKEASKLEDKEFRSPYQEHLSSSEMPSASKAVDSDENGANVLHNEMDHAHKVSKENALETADLVQNAAKQNDNNIKIEDFSEAYPRNEKETDIGSSQNSRQKEMEENVKESGLSSNPESGGGLVHKSGETAENVKETEIASDKEEEKIDLQVVHKERNMEKDLKKAESTPLAGQSTVNPKSVETDKEMKKGQNIENAEKYFHKSVVMEGKETRETLQKEVKEKDNSGKIEAIKREREREKDRIAVERAIREARERAFAEARERAERAAVERAAAEVRQRVMAEAREKLEKATAGSKLADKAPIGAKLRAERAAVERATAEARERALEKALSQKSTVEARVQTEKFSGASRDNGLKHIYSSSDLERFDGSIRESAQRRKARLERHQRIMERVEKALAEKNKRDILAEKEQGERNRLAESLDADIKRWASGKEGNLRALLSTLQYILGPDSGWQPISLSEIITTAAVKKAYRKATLYVHPDKLQQRGASIKQKYICEKVFDLLKAAWSKL